MRYSMPHFPGEFEIPDDWLTEAGAVGFLPPARAYRSSSDAILVQLTDIEPPYRVVRVAKDWRGFDRSRFVSVLKGIVAAAEIEPMPLLELPVYEFGPSTYRYRVRNGFHRFYAWMVAGFECLAAVRSLSKPVPGAAPLARRRPSSSRLRSRSLRSSAARSCG